jgi:hypothetical protein
MPEQTGPMMRRVLMVSPHFPPDSTAAAHRVRLLASHLPEYGWEPTVVTVDPRDYETPPDLGLLQLVPPALRVLRCRAWAARYTRWAGVGDLGLRALIGMGRLCMERLRSEPFDALFITIYPTYTALLGPVLKRRFRVPFILDYQDPWVGAWGATVGSGHDGEPDLKSRLVRAVAKMLEPHVVGAADAITAVSSATYEQVRARHPKLSRTPCAAIPVGGEPADLESIRRHPEPNPYFDPNDAHIHLCYVGTLPPLGFEALRAMLSATALLRQRRPELYQRLRLHFFGTSGQRAPGARARVLPIARELCVSDIVTEVAPRLDYRLALTVQAEATALVLIGSSEPHYTASRLYPALLAERPILAVYHDASSVVDVLRRVAPPPAARLVTYDDAGPTSQVERIYTELASLCQEPCHDVAIDDRALAEFSAGTLAGRLAAVLERAVIPR